MQLFSTNQFGWDPFSELRKLQSEMNRLFDDNRGAASARAYPPVNLWVGERSVVVTAELPGVERSDINLTVRDDSVSISGERKLATTDAEVAWHRRERVHGGFNRTIDLPFKIDPDEVVARFHNGLLEIEMQRPSEDLPRRIEVSSK